MARAAESAVTPVIGTILILAISIAGIGVAILFGAPVLQRLQEQAALEGTLAQMHQLRAAQGRLAAADSSAEVGVSLPGGTMGIETGTHVLVTTYMDPAYDDCGFHILGWEDGDTDLAWTLQPGCRGPAVDDGTPDSILIAGPDCYTGDSGLTITVPGPGGGTFNLGALACFEAYKSTDLATDLVSANQPASLCTNVPTVLYQCNGGVRLIETLDADEDWMFRLTDGASTVYLEGWLLHSDRLTWTRGSVGAIYEMGAIFASDRSGTYLQADPPLAEQTFVSGDEFLLRVPSWQGSAHGAFGGDGVHTLAVVLDEGHVRTNGAAEGLRIDFQGDLAREWCQALLQRDGYAEDDDPFTGDPTRTCDPADPSEDLVRGLLYDLPSGTPSRVLQQVFHGEIKV